MTVSTERSMQALLALVEDDRAARSAAIASEAEAKARAMLREARASARAKLREALAEERRRLREKMGAAEAELATARRGATQKRSSEFLARAWKELPGALLERWNHPESRALWAEHVLAVARESLPGTNWAVAHAPGWPESETAALAARLAPDPVFAPDATIRAGLKVRAAGNLVDGTLEGLLADRDGIGARLLDLFQPAAGGSE